MEPGPPLVVDIEKPSWQEIKARLQSASTTTGDSQTPSKPVPPNQHPATSTDPATPSTPLKSPALPPRNRTEAMVLKSIPTPTPPKGFMAGSKAPLSLKSPHKQALERSSTCEETMALQQCLQQCDHLMNKLKLEKRKTADLEDERHELYGELDTTRETLARTEKRVRVMCHVSNLRIRATEATSEYHSLPLCFVWRSCARLQREQARRQIVANWRSACLKAASESSEPTRQLREEQAVVKKLEASLAESSTQHETTIRQHTQELSQAQWIQEAKLAELLAEREAEAREILSQRVTGMKTTREATSSILCLAACLTEERRDSQVAALVAQCDKIEKEAELAQREQEELLVRLEETARVVCSPGEPDRKQPMPLVHVAVGPHATNDIVEQHRAAVRLEEREARWTNERLVLEAGYDEAIRNFRDGADAQQRELTARAEKAEREFATLQGEQPVQENRALELATLVKQVSKDLEREKQCVGTLEALLVEARRDKDKKQTECESLSRGLSETSLQLQQATKVATQTVQQVQLDTLVLEHFHAKKAPEKAPASVVAPSRIPSPSSIHSHKNSIFQRASSAEAILDRVGIPAPITAPEPKDAGEFVSKQEHQRVVSMLESHVREDISSDEIFKLEEALCKAESDAAEELERVQAQHAKEISEGQASIAELKSAMDCTTSYEEGEGILPMTSARPEKNQGVAKALQVDHQSGIDALRAQFQLSEYALQAQLDQFRDEVECLEEANATASAELATTMAEKVELLQEISTLKWPESGSGSKEEVNVAVSDIDTQTDVAAESEASVAALREEANSLRSQLQQQAQMQAKHAASAFYDKQELEKARDELKECQQQHESTQEALATMRNEMTQAAQTRVEAGASAPVTAGESSDSDEDLDEMRQQLGDTTHLLERTYKELQEAKDNFSARESQMQQAIAECQETLQEAEREADEESEELYGQIQELQSGMSDLKKTKAKAMIDAARELTMMRTQLKKEQTLVNKLEHAGDTGAISEAMKLKLEARDKEISEGQATIAQLRSAMDYATSCEEGEVSALQSQIEQLRQQKEEARKISSKEVSKLKKQLADVFPQAMAQLDEGIKEAENTAAQEIKRLQTQLLEAKSTIKTLKKANQGVQTSQTEVSILQSELKEKKERIALLECSTAEDKATIHANENIATDMSRIMEQRNLLQKEMAALNQTVEEQAVVIATLKEQATHESEPDAGLIEDAARLRVEVQEQQVMTMRLVADKAKLESESAAQIKKLQVQLSASSVSVQSLEAAQSTMVQLQVEAAASHAKSEKTTAEEIEQLQAQLGELQVSSEALEASRLEFEQDARDQADRDGVKIKENHTIVVELRCKLSSVEADLAQQAADHAISSTRLEKAEIKELELAARLSDAEAEAVRWKEEVEKAKHEATTNETRWHNQHAEQHSIIMQLESDKEGFTNEAAEHELLLGTQIRELESTVSQLRLENENALTQLAEDERKHTSLLSEQQTTIIKLRAAQEQAQNDAAVDEAVMQARRSEQEAESKQLQLTISETANSTGSEIHALKQDLAAKDSTVEAMRGMLASQEAKVATVEKAVADSKDAHNQLKIQAGVQEAKLTADIEAQKMIVAQLEESKTSMGRMHQAQEATMASRASEHAALILQLKASNTEVVEAATADRRQFEVQIAELRALTQTLETSRLSSEQAGRDQADRDGVKIKESELTVANLKERLNKVEEDFTHQAINHTTLSTRLEKAEIKELELAARLSNAEAEAVRWKEEVDKAKHEATVKDARFSTAALRIVQLEKDNARVTTGSSHTAARWTEREGEHSKEKQALMDRVEDLQRVVNHLETSKQRALGEASEMKLLQAKLEQSGSAEYRLRSQLEERENELVRQGVAAEAAARTGGAAQEAIASQLERAKREEGRLRLALSEKEATAGRLQTTLLELERWVAAQESAQRAVSHETSAEEGRLLTTITEQKARLAELDLRQERLVGEAAVEEGKLRRRLVELEGAIITLRESNARLERRNESLEAAVVDAGQSAAASGEVRELQVQLRELAAASSGEEARLRARVEEQQAIIITQVKNAKEKAASDVAHETDGLRRQLQEQRASAAHLRAMADAAELANRQLLIDSESEKAQMRLQLAEQRKHQVEESSGIDWKGQLEAAQEGEEKWRKEHEKVNGELGKVKKELRTKLTILRTLQTA